MLGLKLCFWLAGIFCFLAAPGVFVPISAWPYFTQIFAVESLPEAQVFVFIVRLLSATYVGIGIFFILLALKPKLFGSILPFSGIATVLIGLACMITGLNIGMPVIWFLGDSMTCIVLGALILLLWPQKKMQQAKDNFYKVLEKEAH